MNLQWSKFPRTESKTPFHLLQQLSAKKHKIFRVKTWETTPGSDIWCSGLGIPPDDTALSVSISERLAFLAEGAAWLPLVNTTAINHELAVDGDAESEGQTCQLVSRSFLGTGSPEEAVASPLVAAQIIRGQPLAVDQDDQRERQASWLGSQVFAETQEIPSVLARGALEKDWMRRSGTENQTCYAPVAHVKVNGSLQGPNFFWFPKLLWTQGSIVLWHENNVFALKILNVVFFSLNSSSHKKVGQCQTTPTFDIHTVIILVQIYYIGQ